MRFNEHFSDQPFRPEEDRPEPRKPLMQFGCPLPPPEKLPFRGPMGRPPMPPRRPMPMLDEEWRRTHYDELNDGDKLSFLLMRLPQLMRRVPGAQVGQKKILSLLTEHGQMSQSELTHSAGMQPGSMSELLMKMEISGYIARFPDPEDRRGQRVSLTEAGTLAAKALMENQESPYAELTEAEQKDLLRLLEKLESSWRKKMAPERIPLQQPQKV